MAHSLRFYGNGVSFPPLAYLSDSGSFLLAGASLRQDGFHREGFWEVGKTYCLLLPFFGPSRILPG